MSQNFPAILDDSIMPLTDKDEWTLRDAFEGTQIFGATGSGKTTGSGATIARRFLSLQFGGLILTAKPDERERWEDYCRETDRFDDLVTISPKRDKHFDFMRYEFERGDEGAGDTTELTALLSSAAKSAGTSISKNSLGESFWAMSLEVLLRNLIELSKLEHGRVSLRHIHNLLSAAPISTEQAESAAWKGRFKTAMANAKEDGNMRDLRLTRDYFSDTYARFSDRTRSSIVAMFNNMADVLLRGTIGKLFSSDKVDVWPEQTWNEHKIFLMDLPVKVYGEAGRIPQVIMKLIWQRAAERRLANVPIEKHGEHRPVFLWADEAQEFITEQDALFQATARSSRVATVYITQNLRSYHTRLGGDSLAEAATDSLLGNLGTKIFHANGDPTTNEWAERLFAQRPDDRLSTSQGSGGTLQSQSRQQSFTPVCPAIEFTGLAKMTDPKAEPKKQGVEAVVYQTGRRWKKPEKPRSQLSTDVAIGTAVIQTGSIIRFQQNFPVTGVDQSPKI